jgi:hypothetical protein
LRKVSVSILSVLILFILTTKTLVAQIESTSLYQYLSPIPFSSGHNQETGITVRYGETLDKLTLDTSLISVFGEKSREHKAKLKLSDDRKTLILGFDRSFAQNEKVRIIIGNGFRTESGKLLPELDYWFYIRDIRPELTDLVPQQISSLKSHVSMKTLHSKGTVPQINVILNKDPSPGYVFCDLQGKPSGYLYAFDNFGTPVFYREFSGEVKNFKPHEEGFLTYYDKELQAYVKLDGFYDPVDTLRMGNGYNADMHEFVPLDNGHVLMLAYDYMSMDLSQIFPGGEVDAMVTGFIIQELDMDGNVVFQWRSWDHLEVSDTYLDCTTSVCDYAHANSLDMDSDTSILISTRNLSEVTKIHRSTGEIIWRMGGKNNQFIFTNDSINFSGQHTVRKQQDGNITMLDNGLDIIPLRSRGLVYEVDEEVKTVIKVKEFLHDPDVYAYVRGNMEKLSTGNYLIYWGTFLDQSGAPVSEYDQSGELSFEVEFDNVLFPPYRCYRSTWDNQVFSLSAGLINFTLSSEEQTSTQSVELTNNYHDSVYINSFLSNTANFSLAEDLPIGLASGEMKNLSIDFNADTAGDYADLLTFCYDTDTSRVTVQLSVTGTADFQTGIKNRIGTELIIYPNPMIEASTINFPNPDLSEFILTIRDTSGKTVRTIKNITGTKVVFYRNGMKPGYYLIEISGDQIFRGKLLVF